MTTAKALRKAIQERKRRLVELSDELAITQGELNALEEVESLLSRSK